MISDHAKSYNASFVSNLPQDGFSQSRDVKTVRETKAVRLLDLNARCREAEREHPATTDDTKVGCRCYSHTVVIVWRIFHCIRIEAPRAKFKHRSHGGKCERAVPAMRECRELLVRKGKCERKTPLAVDVTFKSQAEVHAPVFLAEIGPVVKVVGLGSV